jgi:HAD domain in Swiss Army Knife RNA repair proteins
MKPASPLLLIDVDGVISLFGFDQTEPPEGRFTMVDGMPHWISGTAGARLARLHATFECVWCTGWEDRADEHLPRLLDLPSGWHHLTFPDEPTIAAHWKLSAIEAYAGENRAVAWIDDAHDDTCHEWAATRPGPTLLVATNPAVGITNEHVETLLNFARAAPG